MTWPSFTTHSDSPGMWRAFISALMNPSTRSAPALTEGTRSSRIASSVDRRTGFIETSTGRRGSLGVSIPETDARHHPPGRFRSHPPGQRLRAVLHDELLALACGLAAPLRAGGLARNPPQAIV